VVAVSLKKHAAATTTTTLASRSATAGDVC